MKNIMIFRILMILALVCVLSACAAKTYKVDFCGEQQMYDGAKDSYAPGKEVTLRYTLIASDTSYAFYLDGEELDVECDSNKGYFIRFTMPDHDVRLECVTKNTMADQIPALEAEPEENLSGNEPEKPSVVPPEAEVPPEEPVKKAVQLLTLSKFFAQQREWDDEILLALSEYNGVTLYGDSIGKYPALAEILEQTKNMAVRSMEDEFDNLLVTAKEELDLLGTDSFVAKESTLDVQIRRADSTAISLLSDSFLVYGNINDRYLRGTTYDTATGKALTLTDVIKDMSQIPAIVKKELTSHTWTGDFLSETAVEDYFRDTPADGISWTLDYHGVTFYFRNGEIAEIGRHEHLAAVVSFAEYPELFNETYMTVPASYIVELPLNHAFYADFDGDGTLEELNVTSVLDESGLYYEAFDIYTDTDVQYYHAEFSADTLHHTGGYHPYYIKTADGRHYLYVFADGSELASNDMTLRVIDITGGGFREVGDMHIAPGYVPVDCSWALTDPDNMMLENFETQQETAAYRVGSDGMPVLK
ncbi:MAG: hypothetical protein E7604_06975 [Ruminococcaceae bacterium]|nr:hypothetical protein [Oscillospiraceae bacterium]